MDDLEKAFHEYFNFLPHHVNKWNQSIQEELPNLKAFKNQTNQYRFVKSKKWNDKMLLQRFPDVQSKLLEKLTLGVEQEMFHLRRLQNILATLNRELFRKYEAAYKFVRNESVSQSYSSKGIVVPPVWQLIELAENSKNYYAALYFQLEITLCSLKYEVQSTVVELENTISEISTTKKEIKATREGPKSKEMLLWNSNLLGIHKSSNDFNRNTFR